jgi:hypothetical protein
MNKLAVDAPIALARPEWRSGVTRSVLGEITERHVNLVVWQRHAPAGVKRALAAWAHSCTHNFEGMIHCEKRDVRSVVGALPEPLGERMARDIHSLLRTFTRITGAVNVRVTFGVVHTDRCRKFHADYVRYRLITTYLGQGTEWLPEEAVNRAAMARPNDVPSVANAAIVRAAAMVRHAVAGDVLLMKGVAPGSPFGAVHRSPPLPAADARRVLLTMSTTD